MKLVVAAGESRSKQLAVRSCYRAKLRRREILWAWLSLLTLVVCWDAAARLDAGDSSLPRAVSQD